MKSQNKLLIVCVVIIAAFIVGLCLIGCANDGVKRDTTNNPKVDVELLFEHDGCKVYRFFDAMHFVYFVRCEASASTKTSWIDREGKVQVPNSVDTSMLPR